MAWLGFVLCGGRERPFFFLFFFFVYILPAGVTGEGGNTKWRTSLQSAMATKFLASALHSNHKIVKILKYMLDSQPLKLQCCSGLTLLTSQQYLA